MDDVIFVGDWVKDRVLGSGSFGIVVLWKHKDTGENLAIKTCKWSDELSKKHKERWTAEVEMLRNFNNPNIVGTKDLPAEFIVGLERANPSGLPILCMEYCSGGDLRQILNQCGSSSGLKEFDVKQILSDIGNAVKFLHGYKITHRDLKPENIVMKVLEATRTGLQVPQHPKVIYKLIDLGYAKELDSNSICASFVGTLQYLAPEIFYSKTYSNSVDFWSLGLLTFEVACGVRPFLPFMAPVQWTPHVKKKVSDNICVYETYHGDIEYSNEIFPENFISKPFKVLLEKWLRVALEWDPKLRGRESKGVTFNLPSDEGSKHQANNPFIIFSMLEDILSRKIIQIFYVSNLSRIAYEIDDSTNAETLKLWIQNDAKIPIEDQILISPSTYSIIPNNELVLKHWNDQSSTMIYLYNKSYLLKDTIEPMVPIAVQRALEHPKALYNYKNSKELYKSGYFFVSSQKEKYDSLIISLLIRSESLKLEAKQLLLQHNSVDKVLGKLMSKLETVTKIIDTGKRHVKELRDSSTGTNFLGGFDNTFSDFNDLSEKINKLQNAWSQVTVRLQSAARRSNESHSADLNNFFTKYSYQALMVELMKIYSNYRKNEREFRMEEKQCHDIMKISYNCLKFRSKVLMEIKHQPCVLKLMDLSLEYSKISNVIDTALENIEKLTVELETLIENITQCMWSTISILSTGASDLADVPYSVVSFEKKEFKVGDSMSSHCIKVNNPLITVTNDDLKSLIAESLNMRKSQVLMNNKLNEQKKMLNESIYDFSYLTNMK